MVSLADYRKNEKKKNKSSLFFETDELFSDKKDDNISIFSSPTSETKRLSLSEYRKTKDETVYKDEDDSSFLEVTSDVLQDIALQPIGGVVDAAESLANLVLSKENEIEISDYIPEAKTTFGRFVRPASQFLIPYTGAYKVARGGYLFIKNAGNLNKAIKVAEKNIKSQKMKPIIGTTPAGDKYIQGYGLLKKTKDLTRAQRMYTGVVAGAGVDAVAFKPEDPNLADLFVQFPSTKNAVFEWLATNPNDDPGMQRLKNVLAGMIPSWAIPEITRGVAKGFSWSTKPVRKKVSKKIEKKAEKIIKQEDKARKDLEKIGKSVKTIEEMIGKRRSLTDKIVLGWQKGLWKKKLIINHLDSMRGLKYLENAAKDIGVKLGGKVRQQLYKDDFGVYKESRFLPAIGGMIEHFMFKTTFRFKDGIFVGTGRDGLHNLLLKNLGKNSNPEDFFKYMGAKSLLSLRETDVKTFNKLLNTKSKVKAWEDVAAKGDAKPNYVQSLNAMEQFNKDLLQIAVDAQLINSKEMARLLAKRKHYLPLYRDFGDDDLVLKKIGASKFAPLKAKVPIGKGKGELPLANLFDNYMENIQGIINASYKNHVKRVTFDLIDAAKGDLDQWAKRIKSTKRKKVVVKGAEIETKLAKEGVDVSDIKLDDLDELALFRSERVKAGEGQEFVNRTVVKKGVETTETHLYDINNPLLKLTMDAISPKHYHATHGVVKTLRWAKNLLTRGVTLDPAFFAGANALRDTFSAAILSRNAFHIPILSTLFNVRKRFLSTKKIKLADGTSMSMKDLYNEFLLNGGSFGSTLLKGEINHTILKSLYRKMGHSDYKNVLNTPKKYLEKYEDVVTGFENASRFTEYTLLRKTGRSAREAAFEAREVAVDFGMHGANNFWRQYVSTVPFLNAGIQGIYRTARAVGRGSDQRAAVLSKLGIFIGTPTLLLYGMNRNNPDYWNQSQQIRDLNFMIPLGDGDWMKIPKPFEFGAIGTVFEGALEMIDKTGNADSFFETAWTVLKHQARLSVVPQVAAPIWNSYLNRTFFGSPIIPEGMKHSIPDYGQSYPWSNKAITAAIENSPPWLRDRLMSPIEFENYIRAYTGAMGGYVLDLIFDPAGYMFSDIERPDKRFDEWPFFKRFLQLDPAKYTQAEAEFYELRKRASQAINIAKKFKKEMKFELLKEFIENKENQELLYISPILESMGKQVSELNKKRNLIWQMEGISSSRKRELLDQIEEQSAVLFDRIMSALESKNLEVFKPVFGFEEKPLDWMFPEIIFGKK